MSARPLASLKTTARDRPRYTTEGKKRNQENRRYLAKKQFDEYDYKVSRFEWNHERRLIAMPDLRPDTAIDQSLG